eukprot:6028070-Prymnesium_polylepis.1
MDGDLLPTQLLLNLLLTARVVRRTGHRFQPGREEVEVSLELTRFAIASCSSSSTRCHAPARVSSPPTAAVLLRPRLPLVAHGRLLLRARPLARRLGLRAIRSDVGRPVRVVCGKQSPPDR